MEAFDKPKHPYVLLDMGKDELTPIDVDIAPLIVELNEDGDKQYYLKESFDNSNRLLKEMGYANLEFVKKPFKDDYDIFVVNSGIVKYVRGVEKPVSIHIVLHKDSTSISIMDGEDTLYDIHNSDNLDNLIYTQQEVIKRVLSGTENLLRETTANIDKDLDDED